jgi:hypothetical protein
VHSNLRISQDTLNSKQEYLKLITGSTAYIAADVLLKAIDWGDRLKWRFELVSTETFVYSCLRFSAYDASMRGAGRQIGQTEFILTYLIITIISKFFVDTGGLFAG